MPVKKYKDKSILFNTEMVKTILEGKKTQTRRIVDYPKSYIWNNEHFKKNYNFDKMFFDNRKNINVAIFKSKDNNYSEWFKCPYQIGQKLWIQETWCYFANNHVIYKADYDNDKCKLTKPLKWKPSIFMPKEYARIWLEVTNIRVERIRDISNEDACRDGGFIYSTQFINDKNYGINRFKILWDSINVKRGYGWDENPWVWVIKFNKIKGDIK
jgi:hypothetical protein